MDFPIIIYLDSNLTKKVRTVQNKLLEMTDSHACIDIWEPHITVGSGMRIDNKDLNFVYKDIKSVVKNFKPFKIKIKNYNFMDNWPGGKTLDYTHYVIYLDVIVNKTLQKLAEELMGNVTAKRERYYNQPWPYNPHLTVAFKDLNKEGFLKAKKILEKEKFEGETIVDHVAIATERESGKWVEYKRFKVSARNPFALADG